MRNYQTLLYNFSANHRFKTADNDNNLDGVSTEWHQRIIAFFLGGE